jgi:hypothetical protein
LLLFYKRLIVKAMTKKKSAVSEYLASIGRKGGAAKVAKGLATLSPEAREKIRAKALATRRKNAAKKAKNTE